MTTLHNDPFNTARVKKEADDDRRAAEAKIAAQEEARKRLASQHLEEEKHRLIRERDEKKKKLDELRHELEEKKRERIKTEELSRTEHAAATSHDAREADVRTRHLLETRLIHVKSSLANLQGQAHKKSLISETQSTQTLSRNLSTAKAGLEKAELEHTQVTEEIKQLRNMLEQKEVRERKIKEEKDEAARLVAKLEQEKQSAEIDGEMKRRSERIAQEAEAKMSHDREAMEREREEIERKILELDEKQKSFLSEKQSHAEMARKADTEIMRTGNMLRDLEFHVDQLVRELALIDGKIRDLDNKIGKL